MWSSLASAFQESDISEFSGLLIGVGRQVNMRGPIGFLCV